MEKGTVLVVVGSSDEETEKIENELISTLLDKAELGNIKSMAVFTTSSAFALMIATVLKEQSTGADPPARDTVKIPPNFFEDQGEFTRN